MIRPEEVIVDLFAGGGGASEAIFQATGRHPDVAINHDEDAVQVHALNHPETRHYCVSVWKVRPEDVEPDRPIGLLWASPDCRHFSRASGGRPKWKSIRSLPGVVLTWATRRRPRLIFLENVPEFETWGPLLDDGTPCPLRIGRSFRSFVGRLRGLGYTVGWRQLCAADYGAPTTRTRLYLVARCDGQPIGWPQATHARRGGLLERPWRSAAECIDWSLPCPSIFDRARPLADATLRRIAHGVMRFVLGAAEPFIVTIDHQSNPNGIAPVGAPILAITAKARHALVAPVISKFYGTSIGSDAGGPLHTITGQGAKHALIAAFLAQHNGGMVGNDVRLPLSTVTTRATQQQAVACALAPADQANAERVWAFLVKYYGTAIGQDLRAPLDTITTKGRFALVKVHGVDHAIVDIGMRMLSWQELAAAQGFPKGYVLDRGADGRAITKTTSVRLIGNSVSPPPAIALLQANLPATSSMAVAA